jgi:hypothetical protein
LSSDTQAKIRQVCQKLAEFLVKKNIAYGDSAINPVRIFSKASPLEQINVRIDDKLNRLMQGGEYPGDNDEWDLAGYLVLKQVAKMEEGANAIPGGDPGRDAQT